VTSGPISHSPDAAAVVRLAGMALFSRRNKSDAAADVPDQGVAPGEQPVSPDAAPPESAEAAPEISISMSSFQGVGAPAAPAPAPAQPAAPQPVAAAPARAAVPAEAPPPRESVPGLRDNVLLADALAGLSESPTGIELMNVARQMLQGHLFLRVQGDARALLAEGKPLPLSIASHGDDRYVLVYSTGAAIRAAVQADGDDKTSAMGQPVLAVLRHVLEGEFAGIILDNSSAPARAVIPRPILERAVQESDERFRIKTLLAQPRTDATAADVASALTEVPVWVAVMRTAEDGPVGVAESRTAEGERFLEVYSHPLESVALARGDATAPITAVQLATALAKDESLSGLLVNPGGPWIRLTRTDLAPLIALAEA
jgi:hypothetical protein